MFEYVCTSSAWANIRFIDDIKTLEKEIYEIKKHENVLVVFDIDHVLIMPTDDTTQNRHSFRKTLWEDITKDLPDSEIRFLTSIIKAKQKWKLVDPYILEIMKYLEKREIPTIALTTRGTGKLGILPSLEQKTQENLAALGIKIPYPKTFHKKVKLEQFKNPDGMPVLEKGVISTSELPKGKILGEYLKLLNYIPKKMIFIDDKRSNIESVAALAKSAKIEFTGYHYKIPMELEKNIYLDKKAERLRFQILAKKHRWLSTEEAFKAIKEQF